MAGSVEKKMAFFAIQCRQHLYSMFSVACVHSFEVLNGVTILN